MGPHNKLGNTTLLRERFMAAKTWMLVCAGGSAKDILRLKPELDPKRTNALAKKLFPSEKLEPLADGTLSFTCPPDNELVIGCYPGLSIIAAKEFGIDRPSKLPARFLDPAMGHTICLHGMHSVVDWFAYAIWKDGKLQRSLSLSPDSGVIENLGDRLSFEEPYWSGDHPASDPANEEPAYPLPFHPLKLGEAALLDLFGYQLEGFVDPSHLEPEEVPLVRYKRSKSWWRRG
jgi:hypothetical protein